MAIVREFTTESGVRVRINDECCRNLTQEELERRRAARDRAIILCQRQAEKERQSHEQTP